MRFISIKENNIDENYLELHYNEIDAETKAVLERLGDTLRYVEGIIDDRKVSFSVSDLFYIENVDRKVYVYTKDQCAEVKESLRDFVEKYENVGFVRIRKSSAVNIYKIKKLQGDLNMRVIIYLKNGEKLIMNRGYRSEFYDKLEKLQGGKAK